MNLDTAISLYAKIENDSQSQNLYARSNARYILFGVDEPRENFPLLLESNLNNGADSLGFLYLSIACTLFENRAELDQQVQIAFEKGAEFIEYNHLPYQNRNDLSQYYLLVSALAYYAANQYSKAFIVIREAENYSTDLALLCSAFLRKDFITLHFLLNKTLLAPYFDENDTINVEAEKQQVYIFSKAISNLMDYLYTGNQNSLAAATEILDDLLELLAIEKEPSMWWIVRIFKIILEGYSRSSLWANISPKLGKGKSRVVKDYINNLIFGKKPITELFPSQRRALPLVFEDKGAVISLPTSSGKTQIAALGILQCLIDNPFGKILYLAPYRSLAFEVENTLKEIFEPLNYNVSQLYGTGQFSKLDKLLIEETNILIATPEKAKVILRANEEIAAEIKLIVIDEGHLLDESKRNVINELFVEELKVYISRNNGKILLLSAVLPNTEDISEWICSDNTIFIAGEEKLARQRLGILDFLANKNTVNLEWYGEESSFNTNFIRQIPPTGQKKLFQPNDKKDAVALTALRLSDKSKTVLIFTARAVSAPPYARAVISAIKLLGQSKSTHKWSNPTAYDEFKLLCSEYESKENAELIKFAEYGILCHYGSLNRDIRLSMEKLMKNSNPRIIVATMTLGQGVNLGVSTVILADTQYYDIQKKKLIDLTTNEVWNIIGRAGRAFQDIEGKILFATETNDAKRKAKKYIDGKPSNAYSGLLKQIKHIKDIAEECNIDFETLIELISNNDLTPFKARQFIKTGLNVKKEFEDIFDWIDDALLSLNIQCDNEDIDDNLRQTLAYIQARDYQGIEPEDVIQFLEARNSALKNIVVPDRSQWRILVSSSLPLASALKLDNDYEEIIRIAEIYLEGEKKIEDKLKLLKEIEQIIEDFPSSAFKPKRNPDGKLKFSDDQIDEARDVWISGKSLTKVSNIKNTIEICNKYFAYTITWSLGAIANKCKTSDREDLSILFEELSLACELGLPDESSAKIYLSGIRSRTAAMDISLSWPFILLTDNLTIKEMRDFILTNIDEIVEDANNSITLSWLEMFKLGEHNENKKIKKTFENFILPDYPNIKATRLYVKELSRSEYYLCSHDYEEVYPIQNSAIWPFETFANRMDYFFEFVKDVWKLKSAVR